MRQEWEQELVSIIVPVYNAKKYIVETIESVLAQSFSHWELLLMEDGSSDGTGELLKEYLETLGDRRLRLICLPENMGAAKARNRGMKMAGGRYIAFLDADDLWAPDKLQRELALMKQKDGAFVFTGYEFADETGRGLGKIVKVPETITYAQALKNTTIFTSTVLLDREKIGEELMEMPIIKSEDTAFWWKLLRNGFVAYGLNENLVKYRRVGKSLSSNKIEALRRIWNLYRKAEGMSLVSCARHFCFWAVNAVLRRI